jgi:predicted TPR repeat methyltransferase
MLNKEDPALLKTVPGGDGVHTRQSKEKVAELFDSVADPFDEDLESLNYQVPKLIGQIIVKSSAEFAEAKQ